jgi:hypothetical protein
MKGLKMVHLKELTVIRSPKHPGALFVKVKASHRHFICKFYPRPNGSEPTDECNLFLEAWEQAREAQV